MLIKRIAALPIDVQLTYAAGCRYRTDTPSLSDYVKLYRIEGMHVDCDVRPPFSPSAVKFDII
jgi:hypothetical protein